MKKNAIRYGALLLLSIVLALVAVLPMQSAQTNRSDWMAELDDAARLNSLTIPGTHDSGALHSLADVAGKCQSLTIEEQLTIGVRFFDVRLQLVDDTLRVVHSFVDQMTDFEDVLSDLSAFVLDHPSEFLLVSIKEDASPVHSDLAFAEVLEEMLFSCAQVRRATSLPETVGAARGGIHVVARYGNASIGVPCYDGWEDDDSFALGDIYVQDNYCVSDTTEKLADIHRAYAVAQKRTHALVLNFTSCYFATCFPPIYAGLPAHDINRDTEKAMAEYADGPLGVLVCDFITAELADAMIGRNFQ